MTYNAVSIILGSKQIDTHLYQVDHDTNLSSSKIGAFETIEVCCCGLKLLFEKIGLFNHD